MRLQALGEIAGQQNEDDRCDKTSNMDIKLMQMEKLSLLLSTGWEVGCNRLVVAFGGQGVAAGGVAP